MSGIRLTQVLDQLNRKERYWVFRAAFGEQVLQLSPGFCQDLQRGLEGSPRPVTIDPSTAWWAVDYHLDWLFVALFAYASGKRLDEIQGYEDNSGELVKGQQEDVDLLVVAGDDIIMVEAKAFGGWTDGQVDSKLTRLNALSDWLLAQKGRATDLRLHWVLCSPSRPRGLKKERHPMWLDKGDFRWIKLPTDPSTTFFEVVRERATADGQPPPRWKTKRAQ